MSEIDGKGSGSEVSESTEVSEAPPAETGGEASEATQEAATEEANESGGFEDTDNTEAPEDGDEDYEATESDYESDESQDVGFNDAEDVDNADSQPNETALDEDDDVFPADENRVGFDDSDVEYNDDGEDNSDTSDEDIDRSNDSLDDSLDEQKDDSNDFDNDIEDPDLEEQQADEDPGELEDYSDEDNLESDPDENDPIDEIDANDELDENSDGDPDGGNAFENDQDTNDDDEAQDEDFDAQSDTTDATDGADTDGTPDGNPDEMTDGDDDLDNGQDAYDNAETQDEDFDAQSDATDATDGADTDGTSDGNPDGEVDGDGQDAEDEDEAQSEPPDAQSEEGDTNAGENTDSRTDGNDISDDTRDSDLDVDEDLDNELAGDYEEDEDPGELEQYPEDDSENREEDRDSVDTDDKTERDKENEDRAAEEENQEASEQAEQEAATVEPDNIDRDEIHSAEGENEKAVEETPETESEKPDSGENVETTRPEEDSDVTLETDTNTLDQDIDQLESSGDEDEDDDLYDSDEYQDEGEVEQYDDVNPAAKENSVDQDAETDESSLDENPLADEVSKSIEDSENDDAHRSAINNMAEYMNEHNYGPDDYAEYSKDPEWQKLNADLQRSLGMEVTSEAPDTTLTPESGKDVSSTELPDNCVVVNASDIDMTYAQGMDSDQFWNHHGNTKEDYMRVAERIPDVQQALDSGKSLDEIKQDPELGDTARAYFDPENMIKVEQQSDGSYSFTDDGRHRIAAAQEYGYQIPVEVTNQTAPIEQANDSSGNEVSTSNVDKSLSLDDLLPPGGPGNPDGPGGPGGPDGPNSPPDVHEFGKEHLNTAANGDDPNWIKSSEIKETLDSIARSDLSGKVDDAIDKLKSGETKADTEFIETLREAGQELSISSDPDVAQSGRALLNLADNHEKALKVQDSEGTHEYNGLREDDATSEAKTERSADGLNSQETEAIRNITAPHFDRAKEITHVATKETADGIVKDDMGANFTDHNENHVEQVKEKTAEVLDASVAAIKEGKLEKADATGDVHFSDAVDYKVTEAAALSHDTGMSDDGYSFTCENKTPVKSDKGTFIIEKQNPENFMSVRDNHSANSALNVLANREQYKAIGFTDTQVDEIAVLTYAHSKSNSGVDNLNDSGSWTECFDRIDALVDQYNKDNPDNEIDKIDRTQFEGEQSKERLGALATETLSLRVGDVSRDSGADALSQSGESVHVEKNTINENSYSYQEEVKNAVVMRGDEVIADEKAKQVHIGEQNIINNQTEFKDGKVTHTITVDDGNFAPHCTAEAIKDHLGELASAKNGEFVVDIKFNEPCDPETQQKYDNWKKAMQDAIDKENGDLKYPNVKIVFPWETQGGQ